MDGEGVAQIMETRVEVRPVATLEPDAIANDPEVALRRLPRDGLPRAVEEKGGGGRYAADQRDPTLRIACQGRGELRPNGQESRLEEFRVPDDDAWRRQVHILRGQRECLAQPQPGAIEQKDQGAEGLGWDAW